MEGSSAQGRGGATLMAGIPSVNRTLYRRIRFLVGDPVALLDVPAEPGHRRILLVRDIEMDRARRHARADVVACPADYAPEAGLSGDRETATAQAAAECARREGLTMVVADRSLPLLYAHVFEEAGIEVRCDPELGIAERRSKDAEEVAALRAAQEVTEGAVEMACRLIAGAEADPDGMLVAGGAPLTSERVRAAIDVWLLERNFVNPTSIVAGGRIGADCHDSGTGPLRTGEPIIVDVFPRSRATLYNGDCTRTVVHGLVPELVERMHAAVVEAKEAAIAAVRPGATGEMVHEAAIGVLRNRGFAVGLPAPDAPATYTAMVHGTGHGVGLDVHEPPLLDRGGPELIVGDALTVEPGLYCRAVGGIRVEDMVVVTEAGCENLSKLPEGLDWSA